MFKLLNSGAQGGYIVKLILIIIAVLLIISYFNIDLENVATSPTAKKNFGYVGNTIVYVWDHFLKKPVTIVYNFIYTYIWEPALGGLERMRSGEPAFDIKNSTPKVTPPR